MFNRDWFLKHQRILLWLVNTPIVRIWFRYLLRINSNRSSVGTRKIARILPNSILWVEKAGKRKITVSEEFRTHDKFAKRIHYAFWPLWALFHAFDMFVANTVAPILNLGFDTFSGYSTAAGDGALRHANNDSGSYATKHDASTCPTVLGSAASAVCIQNETNAGEFYIGRSTFPFLISDIGAVNGTISTDTLPVFSVWESGGGARTGDGGNLVVVRSTQAAFTGLAAEDWDQLGTVSGGAVATTSVGTNQYTDITLNATAVGWMDTAGYAPLGCRASKDIDNTQPTGIQCLISCYYSDQTGTDNDPKLVITYTIPTATGGGFFYYM